MNCNDFEQLAGELLEGESHSGASVHLASCPHCRLLMDELAALQHAARTLPACEPGEHLWEKLQAAAAQEGLWKDTSRWRWLEWLAPEAEEFVPARPAFAAVLALMLLAGAGLLRYSDLDSSLAVEKPDNPIEVAQAELVQEAGYATRYDLHLQNLEADVRDELAREVELTPRATRPLDDVDRAIEETRQQLNTNPDDGLSRDELLRLYRQKAGVLQALATPTYYEEGR